MKEKVPYEDAVDLLDADHKAVKKMFIDYTALCENQALADDRRVLALKICAALTVHAQIEEEIFYPAVQGAIGDDALMQDALQEHAQAKATIVQIKKMDAHDMAYDDTVKKLGKLIDAHVLEEREQIFLKARMSTLDLRGLAVPLYARKKQLDKTPEVPEPAAGRKVPA